MAEPTAVLATSLLALAADLTAAEAFFGLQPQLDSTSASKIILVPASTNVLTMR